MSNKSHGLSRRQILAAMGGIGAAGLTAGVGTSATLRVGNQTSHSIQAGIVDIATDCEDCTIDGNGVSFTLGEIEPGRHGETEFQLTVPDDSNAVRLWMHTHCPSAVDPLGEALEVQLFVQDCESIRIMGSTFRNRRRLAPESGWLTLSEFREELTEGIRIDDPEDPCFGPGTERCLLLRYRLASDADWAVAAKTELEFVFAAQQCRHVEERTTLESPLGSEECPELDCPDCVELGKLDVENDRLEAGKRYPLDAEGYEIEILSTTAKTDGESTETVCAAFRLLKDGSERDASPICRVAVGGGVPQGVGGGGGSGPPDNTGGPLASDPHPSDSEARVVSYDVEPPLTRTRGKLCAVHGEDKSAPESVPDGERPAISNITVFVCADGSDEPADDPECVSCPDGGERIVSATFEYDGPENTTIDIDQRASGNSSHSVSGLDPADSFTVPLNGSGRPDFDVVASTDNAETTVGNFHTSCSQPFGPGTEISDGTYSLTVLEAFDKAGRSLCEPNNS